MAKTMAAQLVNHGSHPSRGKSVFSNIPRPMLWPTHPHAQWVLGSLTQGVNQPRTWISTPSSAQSLYPLWLRNLICFIWMYSLLIDTWEAYVYQLFLPYELADWTIQSSGTWHRVCMYRCYHLGGACCLHLQGNPQTILKMYAARVSTYTPV